MDHVAEKMMPMLTGCAGGAGGHSTGWTHLFSVEGAILASDALANHFCILVNEHGWLGYLQRGRPPECVPKAVGWACPRPLKDVRRAYRLR